MHENSTQADVAYWNKLLAGEGMPARLPQEKLGKRVVLGDGLGGKTTGEEDIEDEGEGHSRMCPINLGVGINTTIDQPADNPLERLEDE